MEVRCRLRNLRHNREEGAARLNAAIAQAKAVQTWDLNALHTIASGYEELALAAGAASDHASALRLTAESMGGDASSGCAVGIVVSYERTLVTVRGADGQTRGSYDDKRRAPQTDASPLIPSKLQATLAGCRQVPVFGPPFIHGNNALRRCPPSPGTSPGRTGMGLRSSNTKDR